MATAINQWAPTSALSLRDAFDRLFEESFVRPFGIFGTSGVNYLPIDLYETNDAFVVRAFVPGVSLEHLDITVEGSMLTIRMEQPAEEQGGVRYHLREYTGGTWVRSLDLPAAIDADNVEARLEHGVLHLTLPKTPEAKAHKIAVKVA
jgi:HSP20 family protein